MSVDDLVVTGTPSAQDSGPLHFLELRMGFNGRSEVGGRTAPLRLSHALSRLASIQFRDCPPLVTSEITYTLQFTAGGRYGNEFRPD
jgi:hypothetical protein